MVGNRILLQRDEGTGPRAKGPQASSAEASRNKEFGKKPEPDRARLSILEANARQPFPGSFGDSFPESTDEDYMGACNCWGDNNLHVTKEELEEKPAFPVQKAPYDLGN